jgi:4-hydroxybenzoate polyprenyltransferase
MPWRDSPWIVFIRERFPPISSVLMILLFVLADGLLASHLMHVQIEWLLYIPAFLLALSFFFRLRLFDEIKDYETDLKINPTRPLARGILTIKQVWDVDLYLIGFEIVLAGLISWYALVAQLIAIGYSLLMYREFFIGSWLRKHLTIYAETHTFVSVLIAYAVAVVIVSKPAWEFPHSFILAGIMFWSIFNLFEFARKTFAPSEERSTVESYSSLFGIKGAVALSLGHVLIATSLAIHLVGYETPGFFIIGFVLGVWTWLLYGIGLIYKRSVALAKLFRFISGFFILYFFFNLIFGILWSK